MPELQVRNKPKDCETLMLKFIKLKRLFNGISSNSNSILKGKIPDLKEIYRHLHKK